MEEHRSSTAETLGLVERDVDHPEQFGSIDVFVREHHTEAGLGPHLLPANLERLAERTVDPLANPQGRFLRADSRQDYTLRRPPRACAHSRSARSARSRIPSLSARFKA